MAHPKKKSMKKKLKKIGKEIWEFIKYCSEQYESRGSYDDEDYDRAERYLKEHYGNDS